jgi:hypothetical protein
MRVIREVAAVVVTCFHVIVLAFRVIKLSVTRGLGMDKYRIKQNQ